MPAKTTTLTLTEARTLAADAFRSAGLPDADIAITVDHLIDCELRGLAYGGLARAVSITERIASSPTPGEISVIRRTGLSATLDGGDRIGYVVAQRATELALELAAETGLCIVGANNTWYTGMFSWYLEQVTHAGYVGMAAGNAGTFVAPYGSTEGLLGTNPIGFGFPSSEAPVIWDVGTSALVHAEVKLAERHGRDLPHGMAWAADGTPTTSPSEALEGALATWGGHRGSGLSLAIHLMGMMTGSPAIPTQTIGDLGFLLILIDPELLRDRDEYKHNVAEHAERIRTARPEREGPPVRVPFDRSRRQREAARERGSIDVDSVVVEALTSLVD
ncbi:Ldh family oxidoreductase [Brevibacterium oceani]|uniref:Ldh family oxidoreductase n=1 Tax=Brevibacterium oceani TaxID=358099 RepID=UPI001B334B3D|nr:Ldh family oxidoreductase [Brevibacterium oceani]